MKFLLKIFVLICTLVGSLNADVWLLNYSLTRPVTVTVKHKNTQDYYSYWYHTTTSSETYETYTLGPGDLLILLDFIYEEYVPGINSDADVDDARITTRDEFSFAGIVPSPDPTPDPEGALYDSVTNTFIGLPGQPDPPSTNHNPTGALESMDTTVSCTGDFHFTGTASDPDGPIYRIFVNFGLTYFDPDAGIGGYYYYMYMPASSLIWNGDHFSFSSNLSGSMMHKDYKYYRSADDQQVGVPPPPGTYSCGINVCDGDGGLTNIGGGILTITP